MDYEKQTNPLEVDFFEQNAVALKLIENELIFPVEIIKKEPSIAKFKLLNNKTQVLVELTDGTIQIVDLMTVCSSLIQRDQLILSKTSVHLRKPLQQRILFYGLPIGALLIAN